MPKCKSSSHVDAVRSADMMGDKVGVWDVQYVAHGTCRNDKGYGGPLFVLTRNGNSGMQMLPELAELLPGQLRVNAAGSNSVLIRHNRFGIKTVYARLLPSAATELGDAIDACVRAH